MVDKPKTPVGRTPQIARRIRALPIWPEVENLLRVGIPTGQVAAHIHTKGYLLGQNAASIRRQLDRWVEASIPEGEKRNIPAEIVKALWDETHTLVDEMAMMQDTIRLQEERLKSLRVEEKGGYLKSVGVEATRLSRMLADSATIKTKLAKAGLLPGGGEEDKPPEKESDHRAPIEGANLLQRLLEEGTVVEQEDGTLQLVEGTSGLKTAIRGGLLGGPPDRFPHDTN